MMWSSEDYGSLWCIGIWFICGREQALCWESQEYWKQKKPHDGINQSKVFPWASIGILVVIFAHIVVEAAWKYANNEWASYWASNTPNSSESIILGDH